jgi:CheY-like chemotaxis protein
VDVLIADIDMPGMKGTDLAQQATERWPHLTVLLVSGGAADVGRVRATGRTCFGIALRTLTSRTSALFLRYCTLPIPLSFLRSGLAVLLICHKN